MLSDDQLDGERYPIISARLLGIVKGPRTVGTVEFEYSADVEVVIHDKTVRREMAVRLAVDGKELSIEVIGEFTFEEFGIEPLLRFPRLREEQERVLHLRKSEGDRDERIVG